MSGVLGVDLSLTCTGWAWLSSEFWADRPDPLKFNNADAIKTRPSEPAMARLLIHERERAGCHRDTKATDSVAERTQRQQAEAEVE